MAYDIPVGLGFDNANLGGSGLIGVNDDVLSGIVPAGGKDDNNNKWYIDLLGDIIQVVPGTISAIKGNTPPATSGGTPSTGGGNGKVTGDVTLDSILSELGFAPKISGVSFDIPKWVYLLIVVAGIMLLFPFLKSFKR